MDILGGEDIYYNLLKNDNSKSGYMFFDMFDQDVFFDWCESLDFDCSNGDVMVRTPGLRSGMVQMGAYEYDPKPGLLWFFYNQSFFFTMRPQGRVNFYILA